MHIFLVEDERWALAELVELCKRYQPEHEIHAFENGEDALAAAVRIKPNLILTDINMPGIDGLELISGLTLLHSDVKSIVLSVHDQFGYVQKGIQIGVIDYLLKPVKKDVLYQTIDQAIQKIENDRAAEIERVNWLIAQMLLASETQNSAAEQAAISGSYVMVLLLHENWASPGGWKDIRITNLDIKRLFVSRKLQEQDIHCLTVDAKRKMLLIPAKDSSLIPSIKEGLANLYRCILQLGVQVNLAYVIKQEKDSLNKCFESLNKLIDDNMQLGVSSFIAPGTKPAYADLSAVWEKVRVLQAVLKQGEMLRGKEVVHKIVAELHKKGVTSNELTLFVNDLFYSLKYNLQASSKTEINMNKLQEDIKFIDEMTTYEQLSDWLVSKVLTLYSEREPNGQKPKGLIPVLLNDIHENYQKNLSLQQFAADNHVSLGYLSRLFKTQTGYTFSDYLIRYRVGKAKELLAEGTARLADISSLVGYEDTKHFSYLFKKIVGEPPMAYAKRNSAER